MPHLLWKLRTIAYIYRKNFVINLACVAQPSINPSLLAIQKWKTINLPPPLPSIGASDVCTVNKPLWLNAGMLCHFPHALIVLFTALNRSFRNESVCLRQPPHAKIASSVHQWIVIQLYVFVHCDLRRNETTTNTFQIRGFWRCGGVDMVKWRPYIIHLHPCEVKWANCAWNLSRRWQNVFHISTTVLLQVPWRYALPNSHRLKDNKGNVFRQ